MHTGPQLFIPTASGVFGSVTLKFLKEVGHHLKQTPGECNAYHYLLQRLSGEVQRENATSVVGSVGQDAVDNFSVTFFTCIASLHCRVLKSNFNEVLLYLKLSLKSTLVFGTIETIFNFSHAVKICYQKSNDI